MFYFKTIHSLEIKSIKQKNTAFAVFFVKSFIELFLFHLKEANYKLLKFLITFCVKVAVLAVPPKSPVRSSFVSNVLSTA